MEVSLLELKTQYNSIKRDIDSAIGRILNSQNFILGEEVRRFEEEIANHCGVKHAIGVASGTDALLFYLCFKYLGYIQGDFPVAEQMSRQVLSIPVFPELSDNQLDYIIQHIEEYLTA